MRSGLLGNVLLEQSEDLIISRKKGLGQQDDILFEKRGGTRYIPNMQEGKRKTKNKTQKEEIIWWTGEKTSHQAEKSHSENIWPQLISTELFSNSV